MTAVEETLSQSITGLLKAAQDRGVPSIAAGIVPSSGARQTFFTGEAKASSVFSLASMTKTYSAELLAILDRKGVVRMNDPLARYIGRAIEISAEQRPIRLVDLATHCSGLPRLAPDVHSLAEDPYRNYNTEHLENYLRTMPLRLPEQVSYDYSNLGYAVLGYALAKAAGRSYSSLLQEELLGPLAMRHTTEARPGELPSALLQGHTRAGYRSAPWTFGAFAPAGSLCSTLEDQMTWIEFLLSDPERPAFQPLAAVGGVSTGLAWVLAPGRTWCVHSGSSFGFSSYMTLHLERRVGLVLLANTFCPHLLAAMGQNLQAKLTEQPAPGLAGDYGLMKARLRDPLILSLQKLCSPFLRRW